MTTAPVPRRPSMTRSQAGEILGLMALAWPGARVEPAALEVIWMPRLATMDYEVARVALDQLVDREAWRPSVAQFRSAYSDALRRSPTAPVPELDEPPASPDTTQRALAKAKEILSHAKGPLAAGLSGALAGDVTDR